MALRVTAGLLLAASSMWYVVNAQSTRPPDANECANAPDPQERKACEAQYAPMKVNVSSHQTREQQLQLQEQQLSLAIATEQNRWADFSARLDDLERALTPPR